MKHTYTGFDGCAWFWCKCGNSLFIGYSGSYYINAKEVTPVVEKPSYETACEVFMTWVNPYSAVITPNKGVTLYFKSIQVPTPV